MKRKRPLSKGNSNGSNGLITKAINLSGRHIVVSEATYLMGIQRGTIIGDILESTDDGDHIVQNVLTSIYAPLAACSSGDVPTKEEFLSMREADIEEWLSVGRKLNSHWFSWMDELEKSLTEQEKKAELQKKAEKPLR